MNQLTFWHLLLKRILICAIVPVWFVLWIFYQIGYEIRHSAKMIWLHFKIELYSLRDIWNGKQ